MGQQIPQHAHSQQLRAEFLYLQLGPERKKKISPPNPGPEKGQGGADPKGTANNNQPSGSPSKSEESPAVSVSDPKANAVETGPATTTNASDGAETGLEATEDLFEGPKQGPDNKAEGGKDSTMSGMSGSAALAGQADMGSSEEAVDSVGSNVIPAPHFTDQIVEERVEATQQKDPEGNRLQLYTPSSMLDWGQFEVKFFQQLYSQTKFWNAEGEAISQGNRSNYYSGIFNFVLGYNKRINFGVDAWLQSVYIDANTGSPFGLFTRPAGSNARTALTAIGPKVKWQPFARLNGLTLQSSLLLPIARDPEGRTNGKPYLATQNILWWTQLFYTYNISRQFQLFAEVDLYWNIDRQLDFQQSGFVATPASAFFSFFPTSKVTVYANTQFWPILGENVISSWWWMAGIGGKYQFSKSLDLELSYGRFLAGRSSAGPAQTFNLGLRFVKW